MYNMNTIYLLHHTCCHLRNFAAHFMAFTTLTFMATVEMHLPHQ